MSRSTIGMVVCPVMAAALGCPRTIPAPAINAMSGFAVIAPGCAMDAVARYARTARARARSVRSAFAMAAFPRMKPRSNWFVNSARKIAKPNLKTRNHLMKHVNKRRPASRRSWRRRQSRCPPLRLTAYAWAKLLTLRDLGETEVGGFGVSRHGDLLLVEDAQLVRQLCTAVTVKFDDQSVADYFDGQVDEGRTPAEFARLWIHTHPGDSPYPSATDEETFDRCFGSADWAVMFILARGGSTYARLRLGSNPGGNFLLPVQIDFQTSFPASDPSAWEAEYLAYVSVDVDPRQGLSLEHLDGSSAQLWPELPRRTGESGLIRFVSEFDFGPLLEHCDA
jgi:proteasome lid subunit RPN8/RPN11